MKVFRISYSFEIKDSRTENITYWERGTYDVELASKADFDGERSRATIKRLAQAHIEQTTEFVFYANYYHIEELSPSAAT